MATKTFKLEGIQTVMANLNRQAKRINGLSMAGLIKSAILIQRSMNTTEPKVPVDTRNLQASWFTTMVKTPMGPSLTMGFGANYAVFVHENMEAKNWKRPGSGPKFFEKALNRNHSKILRILQANTMIK